MQHLKENKLIKVITDFNSIILHFENGSKYIIEIPEYKPYWNIDFNISYQTIEPQYIKDFSKILVKQINPTHLKGLTKIILENNSEIDLDFNCYISDHDYINNHSLDLECMFELFESKIKDKTLDYFLLKKETIQCLKLK